MPKTVTVSCTISKYVRFYVMWLRHSHRNLNVQNSFFLKSVESIMVPCEVSLTQDDVTQPMYCFITLMQCCHYENTPIQIHWEFYHKKNENFQIKKSDIFHVFAQNIDCGHSLEPPRRGGSNECPQSMFWAKIRKLMYTPVNPSFTIKKLDLRGSTLYRHVFVMDYYLLIKLLI